MTIDRRTFLNTTVVGAVAVPAIARSAFAVGNDRLGLGVVGCGGRGTGAAFNAISASPDIDIVAIGDLYADRLNSSRSHMGTLNERMKVTDDDCYTGWNAYQQVMARPDVDVVILATPPHFRPEHFRHAIASGKHVFMEKPVAVDPAGIRKVIAAAAQADAKNLSVVAGTQRRHEACYLDAMRRIRDGEIGEPVSACCYWNQGGLWSHDRQPDWTDMDWQLRNWLYFTWLSGDHITEQHVHNLDATNWALGGHPVKATGMGGRQTRIEPRFGHGFDHFAIDYEYPGGIHAMSMARQADGCVGRVEEIIQGTKGRSVTSSGRARFEGGPSWTFENDNPNPYVVEHRDLHASIRGEQPRLNEGQRIAESTLTAIMGRMSAYSGKTITWNEAMNADLDMTPPQYAFGTLATPVIARPGTTSMDDELWPQSDEVTA